MPDGIPPVVREKAPLILAEVNKAGSVLLHCHPSPDPDSVGSALAMKLVLEQMGKRAEVIRGDSPIPDSYSRFPGAGSIVRKDFTQVKLKDFDLFLSLDAANAEQVTRYARLEFPLPIKTIVIDHHGTNPGYGDINLIAPEYPATAQILFDLFKAWNVELVHDAAADLFVGMYADTGGFKYQGTTDRTFLAAAELSRLAPDFPKIIAGMENSDSPQDAAFRGLALSKAGGYLDGKIGLSVVPYAAFRAGGIEPRFVRAGSISAELNAVKDWLVTGAILEAEPGKVRLSFRSKDADKFDVSKLAEALGGGGHRAASGAVVNGGTAEEVVNAVVAKAKEIYNL